MRRSLPLLVLVALAATFSTGARHVASPVTDTQSRSSTVELRRDVFVWCANDGAGEIVELFGNLHTVVKWTVSADGTVRAHNVFNPTGVVGIGEVTGDVYRGTGATIETIAANESDGVIHLVNRFRLIGAGDAPDLVVRALSRVTIDDGVVTQQISTVDISCA